MESPDRSDIENEARGKGIAWKGGGTQWLLFFMSFSYSSTPYLLGSDMGALLWSQGLEGTSVSIGCEIRKLKFGRGEENMQWGPKWITILLDRSL